MKGQHLKKHKPHCHFCHREAPRTNPSPATEMQNAKTRLPSVTPSDLKGCRASSIGSRQGGGLWVTAPSHDLCDNSDEATQVSRQWCGSPSPPSFPNHHRQPPFYLRVAALSFGLLRSSVTLTAPWDFLIGPSLPHIHWWPCCPPPNSSHSEQTAGSPHPCFENLPWLSHCSSRRRLPPWPTGPNGQLTSASLTTSPDAPSHARCPPRTRGPSPSPQWPGPLLPRGPVRALPSAGMFAPQHSETFYSSSRSWLGCHFLWRFPLPDAPRPPLQTLTVLFLAITMTEISGFLG